VYVAHWLLENVLRDVFSVLSVFWANLSQKPRPHCGLRKHGLVSQSQKLSNNSFESIKIDFSDTDKQYNYHEIESSLYALSLIPNLSKINIKSFNFFFSSFAKSW
jgi:hypothetical protein